MQTCSAQFDRSTDRAKPIVVVMRKAREVASAKAAGEYATAGCLSATLAYAPMKPSQLPQHIAVVLWLPEAAVKPAGLALPARVGKLLPAVQRVLMCTESSSTPDLTPPDAIFIVDCSPLVPTGGSAKSIIDQEVSDAVADRHLGKQISRPVSRLLERLCVGYRGHLTLVGLGCSAPLALCLLEHGTKMGSVDRAILLQPHLSAAVVNALLVKPAEVARAVDVYYDNARESQRRDAALRHAYPTGNSHVLAAHVANGVALYMALCGASGTLSEVQGARVEPEAIDSIGRAVWWNEWSFELNPRTKQPEARVIDLIASEVAEALATPLTPPRGVTKSTGSAATAAIGATVPTALIDGEHRFAGSLVLRGNRCLLVRSLESPPAWSGLRIPTAALRSNETAIEGASRAAIEMCDIEHTEIEHLPGIPPVALHLERGQAVAGQAVAGTFVAGTVALIYPLYAVNPPPPGALEDADLTDEEDLYDW